MPIGSASGLRYLPCLFALFLILVSGVYDDFRPVASHYKLLAQSVAALIVIIPGFTFQRIVYFPIGSLPVALGYAITLLWIVGLSNAINLIDGIDGLAGGLSGLIALFYGLIFYFNGVPFQKILFCTALVGVVAGFLVFNAPFPKAKIFMGDCGSQFLGFLLALLPLLAKDDSRVALPVPYAAALLMIPIFDTTAAAWRRIREGRRIDEPDTFHVHHKLLNLGLSVRQVDAVLCGLQVILGVLVFVSVHLDGLPSLYVLGGAYIIGLVFFTVVHYKNCAVVKAGMPPTNY
ncbi:MAG: undecaprenyl/decaprenyl-phosphate alpha-N-acetylglucosaminyl 1-phosphate transferase [Treponema sp.]|jgi:UDP-GlcNAc:undecaprenyl-phosphate GlcNAc-1-phosphate transferase|nr:undecaprenyl/decaprenyl-phosphate alpha-N-acetylglucosaminyl 1-phosphate transferase [Treponema sp.]